MVLALASGPMALALRAALTIFCHHHRTHGLTTTTTKIKLLTLLRLNYIVHILSLC